MSQVTSNRFLIRKSRSTLFCHHRKITWMTAPRTMISVVNTQYLFHHVQRRMVVMIINMKRARKTLMGAAIGIFHHQIPKLMTVSSCPYPSSIEEMTRFGLKGETEGNPSASGSSMHSENTRQFRRKRKSSNPSCTVPKYLKLPKRSKL
ncbi:hypothetical protein PVL29_006470 [Vitis rotundifolia]|uniref:Uncharacterized protein n=1 Tax=Vitis rotundifolia TaxID=103349 RepID=A0AA39A539_VITRO|nr:hypothetical protein PVL29_006470 [Vitis rotundifolia]